MSKFLDYEQLQTYTSCIMNLINIDYTVIEFDTDELINNENSAILGECILGTMLLGTNK